MVAAKLYNQIMTRINFTSFKPKDGLQFLIRPVYRPPFTYTRIAAAEFQEGGANSRLRLEHWAVRPQASPGRDRVPAIRLLPKPRTCGDYRQDYTLWSKQRARGARGRAPSPKCTPRCNGWRCFQGILVRSANPEL